MNPHDFIFTANFPNLASGIISSGADIVAAQWYGALNFWSKLDQDLRDKKRTILLNLLTAWYLSNKYPSEVVGIISNGGIPLTSKSIGGVSVSFLGMDSVQDALKPLLSNTFGVDAMTMMMSAPERFEIYG